MHQRPEGTIEVRDSGRLIGRVLQLGRGDWQARLTDGTRCGSHTNRGAAEACVRKNYAQRTAHNG